MARQVPQPHVERITPFKQHPVVVGVIPGQPDVLTATAVALAQGLGVGLFFAFVDPQRVTEQEFADGTVRHSGLDPDLDDERWRDQQDELLAILRRQLEGTGVAWEFRFLAGRADRALTHLARAVDASAIVVGSTSTTANARMHRLLEGSLAEHLTHHQHRPVLVVPTAVVDWKDDWR